MKRAQRVAAGAEVGLPVGGDVVEPPADQAERHREHRDVDDRAGRPPRATNRFSPQYTATTMPAMMHSA